MALNELPNEVSQNNSNVSLTSLNITITLAFFGMMWSIASYILFTKWKCTNDQSIWENQLLPILKPIWDTYGYPILYTICCALCNQNKYKLEKRPVNGEEVNKPYQRSATPISGVSSATGYQSISSINGANGHQSVSSINGCSGANAYQSMSRVNGANGYQSISGENSGDTIEHQRRITRANSADRYLSSNGYETVDMNDEEKGLINDRMEPGLEDKVEDHDPETPPDDTEQPKKPLLKSSMVIMIFSAAHIVARPFIIIVNIIYLALYYNKDLNADEPEGYSLTDFSDLMMFQETTSLVAGPILNAIYWVCCWRQCRVNNCFRKYLELLRFADLQFVLIAAPFTNARLYTIGGWWYIVIIVRLVFYGITFASAVVAGMRFVCACYCKVFCTCGCDNDVLEIRNKKHLFLEIGFALVPIFIKINASSSAIATFVKLGNHGGLNFQKAYFAFTIIRSITSLFSLIFSGAMLRWAVLKKEHKWEDRSWLTKWLRFLNKYQPHIHGSFFFDMLTYFGLIVLNLILLDLVTDENYYNQ